MGRELLLDVPELNEELEGNKTTFEKFLRWVFIKTSLGLTGLHVEVKGKLPEGNKILAIVPHTSQLDNIVLFEALMEEGISVDELGMLVKGSYWQGWRQKVSNFLLGKSFAVEEETVNGLRDLIKRLKVDNSVSTVGAYIQGGRDAEMEKSIESGVAFISLGTQYPIIPVAILGLDGQIMPKGKFFSEIPKGLSRTLSFRRKKILINFGDPIEAENLTGSKRKKLTDALKNSLIGIYQANETELPPFLSKQ